MMRSLFSGVSGLKNHQTRMDVIGNNISNVNTTGFKSSRVNFTDILSQNIQGASAPNENVGGTNPKQIGLGSAVGAVDLLFTNGSVQSTGVNTDLALSSSNALFILNTGSGTAYTRNGDFQFDAEGNYVQAGNGYFVQGWMANNGTIDTGSQVTNITIPSGKSMPPKASVLATYTNNLNAEVPTITNITGGEVTETKTKTYENATDGSMTGSEKYPLTITTADGKTYPSIKEGTYVVGNNYIAHLATGTAAATDQNKVEATLADGTKQLGTSGSSYTVGNNMTFTAESYKATDANTVKLTLNDGYVVTSAPNGTYAINGNYTYQPNSVEAKDTNVVTLRLSNGTSVTGVTGTTYTKGTEYSTGVTIDDISVQSKITNINVTAEITALDVTSKITKMEQQYASGVTATSDNPATLTLSDGSKITQTSGAYNVDSSLPIVTTLSVYDTLGSVHDVTVYFTLTNAAQDTWQVALTNDGSPSTSWKEADGSTTTVTMEPVDLDFDTNGAFSSGSGKTTLTLTNGSTPSQSVTLDFSQLTQYSSSSTIAGKADGNAAGTLSSVSIDKTGTITGTYTNGMKQTEAQVALQRFNNPGGLTKVGESLYEDSNNAGRSGEPSTASTLGATITPAALEMSNVDIANEFTDMIITQRGFQGNSKIITVSDEMLETLINLKR